MHMANNMKSFMKKLCLILPGFIFILGCQKVEDTAYTEVVMPYLYECQNAFKRARESFSQASDGNDYRLGIDIETFDVNSMSHQEVLGIVRLYSIGDWKTLDGGSPEDYLILHATGIRADCMANNSLEINEGSLSSYSNIVNNLPVYLKYKGKKLVLYFNDGNYTYLGD